MLSTLRRRLRPILRRPKPPVEIAIPPGFVPARGLGYVEFLSRVHERHLFDWTLEIGCRSGTTFAPVRGKTIAVDPFFQASINVIGRKPQLHVFQATSDDFFASGFLGTMGIRLSFSFLDGMHLIDYLLRDFIGTEAASHPGGVIAIHDCLPYSHDMTTRDLTRLGRLPRQIWTGDVWKLIPILQRWRPDLTVTVLDCAQTGLVLVSDLSPGDTTLRDRYDAIMAEFRDRTLQDHGVERFFGSFAVVPAAEALETGAALWEAIALPESAALNPVRITL